MKNLKTTILTAFIAICCLTNGNAQENARGKTKGKVTTAGSPGSIIAFGGGASMPSSNGKDKAFLSNSTAINADAFFSLISKPEANFSFGLNFGGAYNFGGSGGFGTTPNPFAVTGQTSSMVSDRGGDPIQAGFRMGAGPQANFYFGKFIVSPMVLGEYFSMTQKERSFVQTTQFNGQSYDFNLATLPETKTSGFAVTPKLRLHYMFNDRFGLFADASYTMGPKIETTVSKLIPNGNPSPQSGSYNIQQLQTGTMVKGETKSTAYSTMGFNFGVVIGLGGKAPHDDGKGQQTHRTADTDDIRKGWNGIIIRNAVCHLKDANGNCDNGGVLCISGSQTVKDLELSDDELLTRAYIAKENNTIRVNSDEIFNKISDKTISKFKNKNVELVATEFPKEDLKKLFESIQLNLPEGANQFLANEISYKVLDDNTIEIKQSKKIIVNKTNYNFNIITRILNRTKITDEEFNAMNGIKNSTENGNNPVGMTHWTECNGGYQYECHIDAGGNIVGVLNGRTCVGNWIH